MSAKIAEIDVSRATVDELIDEIYRLRRELALAQLHLRMELEACVKHGNTPKVIPA